jgi:hypothetical protein
MENSVCAENSSENSAPHSGCFPIPTDGIFPPSRNFSGHPGGGAP